MTHQLGSELRQQLENSLEGTNFWTNFSVMGKTTPWGSFRGEVPGPPPRSLILLAKRFIDEVPAIPCDSGQTPAYFAFFNGPKGGWKWVAEITLV